VIELILKVSAALNYRWKISSGS